jgi:hypothetical protein
MTDYEKLKAALLRLGAEQVGFIENFICDDLMSISAEKWLLNDFGFIVCVDIDKEQVGIYAFVGVYGAGVEEDIAFLEKLAAASNPVCGLIEQ